MVNQIMLMSLDVLLWADESRMKEMILEQQRAEVPVIVFGDCDRAELEPIRERLGISGPFIVESGSAVFTPVDNNPFDPPLGEQDGNYYGYELGCPYVQARAGLRVLANEISHPLKGFGDFTVPQLERTMQLSEDEAHRAKAREFSEPFMTPKSVDLDELKQAAKEIGFDVVLKPSAESRFSFLVGAEASLAGAVRSLISAYQALKKGGPLNVVGISAQVEDLQALATVGEGMNWSGVLISEAASASEVLPENTKIVVCDRPADWLKVEGV